MLKHYKWLLVKELWGFFSLFGGGCFGFLAKTKPETRGGEGTV